MENLPRFVLMPSLEQMALRRVAVSVYSDPLNLAMIAKFEWEATYDIFGNGINKDFRRDAKCTVSALQLPESLRMHMLAALKAVGLEIFTWKSIHKKYLRASNGWELACFRKLCWTSAGAVDYRRTAEGLVHCDSLNIEKRFELACLYCLQDSVPLLWKQLPDKKKRTFSDEDVNPHLQLLLPSILDKQSEIKDSLFSSRNSFEKSALCGNRTLTEFCFRNLTKEEREASLVRTARNVIICRNYEFSNFDYRRAKLTDVLCYLLSLMTREERVGIFREMPCNVLRCFLDWPWQDLFLDIADAMWAFLPESEYNDVVSVINQSMFASGYYFPTVFRNLFERSPREWRKSFSSREIRNGCCLRTLLVNEDTETIRAILRNLDAADRVRLVFSSWSLDVISQPAIQWRVVEEYLRAAALSRDDKQKLKRAFLKRRTRFVSAREKHKKFLEFVEN